MLHAPVTAHPAITAWFARRTITQPNVAEWFAKCCGDDALRPVVPPRSKAMNCVYTVALDPAFTAIHDHCPSVAAAKLKKSSCWAVARIARGRVFRELHGIRYGRQPVFPANCPSFTGRAGRRSPGASSNAPIMTSAIASDRWNTRDPQAGQKLRPLKTRA